MKSLWLRGRDFIYLASTTVSSESRRFFPGAIHFARDDITDTALYRACPCTDNQSADLWRRRIWV